MITVRGVLVALTVIAAGIGCSGQATSPNPPSPGSAVVSLATPNIDDGAVVVTLRGPGLTTLQSTFSSNVFYSRLVGDSARIILVGNLGAGPLFTFKFGTGAALSAYTATVEQVATRSDSLHASTTGYHLTVSAAP